MASSSKADDHGPYTSTDDDNVNPSTHKSKRRKGPKACDICRRKKIRCDPDPAGDSQKSCVNCTIFKTECTYTYVAKKRRTQQAYIDSLQHRLNKLERLLVTLAPDIDLSKEFDHIPTNNLPRPSRARNYPLKSISCSVPAPNVKPSELVAAFTEWRQPNNSSEDDSDDGGLAFIPADDSGEQDAGLQPFKFLGHSSGIELLHTVIGMKKESTEGRPAGEKQRWVTYADPWDGRLGKGSPPKFAFPPSELLSDLVSLFFPCVNDFYPLLHRPTFERLLNEGRHEKDPDFGAVVLLVCAVASRWSNDRRVLPNTVDTDQYEETWAFAGWDFYWQVHQRHRRDLIQSTSVYDLQMLALACIYMLGTTNSSISWQMAGLGVRLALEAGVHRRKRPGSRSLLDEELQKRAFWTLVVLDRMVSAILGRPCAIWEEDIDLDLPLEVDDEYLTDEAGYAQPASKPPRIAYFNSWVKLSQILIGALRSIYPISRSKSVFRLMGPTWEQEMVAALDSSLNSWKDGIPEHLQWDHSSTMDDVTFRQSALLHTTYYYVQIVVHRPYITRPRSRKSGSDSLNLSFPSLAMCTNAARSCSHVLEACLRRETVLMPQQNHCAFTAAIVLLFNVWGMNKPGMVGRVDWEKQLQDVYICMKLIKRSIGRWQHATRLWNMLRDLVFVGDFPLPKASPPRYSDIDQAQAQDSKRSREREDTPDLDAGLDTATTSPSIGAEQLGAHISSNHGIGYDYGGHGPENTLNQGPEPPAPANDHVNPQGLKQDQFGFDQRQHGMYMEESNALSIEQMLEQQSPMAPVHYGSRVVPQGVPLNQRANVSPSQGQTSQTVVQGQTFAPPTNDFLTALNSVYVTNNSPGLVGSAAMDVAQHACTVWESVPGGFQWDEWQQFTNTVQNVAPEAETGMDPGVAYFEQPLPWRPY